jgi:hypothetical protein
VIRDKRLYRAQGKTFEDYCQERFGIGRNYVNRRLVFAGIIENLVPRGTKPIPATEYQARPLTALPTPELQAEAWSNAQSAAGKDQRFYLLKRLDIATLLRLKSCRHREVVED